MKLQKIIKAFTFDRDIHIQTTLELRLWQASRTIRGPMLTQILCCCLGHKVNNEKYCFSTYKVYCLHTDLGRGITADGWSLRVYLPPLLENYCVNKDPRECFWRAYASFSLLSVPPSPLYPHPFHSYSIPPLPPFSLLPIPLLSR